MADDSPIVEKVVYRGVLYSAMQRAFKPVFAVGMVTLIFTAVHVAKCSPDYRAIISLCFLSFLITLVRAKTGNLLPCIAIHLVFNGFQSLLLIFEPYLPSPDGIGANSVQFAILLDFIHKIPTFF